MPEVGDLKDLVVHNLLLLGLDPHHLAQQDQKFRYFAELQINPNMFDASNPQALELCVGFLMLKLVGGHRTEDPAVSALQRSFPTYRDAALIKAFRGAVLELLKGMPVDEHNAKFALANAQGERALFLLLQLSRFLMRATVGGGLTGTLALHDPHSPAATNTLRALIHRERMEFERNARAALTAQRQLQDSAARLLLRYRSAAAKADAAAPSELPATWPDILQQRQEQRDIIRKACTDAQQLPLPIAKTAGAPQLDLPATTPALHAGDLMHEAQLSSVYATPAGQLDLPAVVAAWNAHLRQVLAALSSVGDALSPAGTAEAAARLAQHNATAEQVASGMLEIIRAGEVALELPGDVHFAEAPLSPVLPCTLIPPTPVKPLQRLMMHDTD